MAEEHLISGQLLVPEGDGTNRIELSGQLLVPEGDGTNRIELSGQLLIVEFAPPPEPLLFQSCSNAVVGLPNSGASSPFNSNWDAKLGLK